MGYDGINFDGRCAHKACFVGEVEPEVRLLSLLLDSLLEKWTEKVAYEALLTKPKMLDWRSIKLSIQQRVP